MRVATFWTDGPLRRERAIRRNGKHTLLRQILTAHDHHIERLLADRSCSRRSVRDFGEKDGHLGDYPWVVRANSFSTAPRGFRVAATSKIRQPKTTILKVVGYRSGRECRLQTVS